MFSIHNFLINHRSLHQTVLKLTWPVVIANLSLPLAGAVDTAVVGHLTSPVYIGAVALGALIFSAVFWLMGFLRMGTTGIVAQCFGADDKPEIRATYLRALTIAVVIGLAIIVLQHPIGSVIFWFFEATDSVEQHGLVYYQIRIWGTIFAFFNLANLGLLFGLQRMRIALGLQILLNGMNIVLDVLFVLGFGWSVAGVAAATLISEAAAAVAGLWICSRLLGLSLPGLGAIKVFQRDKFRRLAEVNTNILIRTLCLESVFIYFMWASAKQGEIILAANAVLLHLMHFLSFGLDGFAHAAEALAGNAYGAKNRSRLNAVVVVCLFWSLVVASVFSAAYLLGGELVISLLTSIHDVQQFASNYLIWLILAPFFCVWPYLFDGVYIGMTRTVEMRNGMLISVACFFVVAYALSAVWGNHGLWIGIMTLMIARGLTLGLWYQKIAARVG